MGGIRERRGGSKLLSIKAVLISRAYLHHLNVFYNIFALFLGCFVVVIFFILNEHIF